MRCYFIDCRSYVLTHRVEFAELSEKTDQSTFTKRVCYGGMKCQGRKFKGQLLDPLSGHPTGNQITFIDDYDQLFV
jgi:hypothetical protein